MDIEVLIVEEQPIFRRGLVACLNHMEGFARVEEAASVADAWSNPALGEVDVVVINAEMDGVAEFVSELEAFADIKVLALGSGLPNSRLGAVLEAGALAGVLVADLTPQSLSIAIKATTAGVALLNRNGTSASPSVTNGHVPLSGRELQVLSLIAEGMTTRTAAIELHYSERTVKKVLSDVIVKLGAQSRSQAIAFAVREGII